MARLLVVPWSIANIYLLIFIEGELLLNLAKFPKTDLVYVNLCNPIYCRVREFTLSGGFLVNAYLIWLQVYWP